MSESYTDVIRRDEARSAYEQWQWAQCMEGTSGIPLWDHLSEKRKADFHFAFAEAVVVATMNDEDD
jgi:hypothetical protein